MRKFYYLLLLLVFAGRAEATIALRQSNGGTFSHVSTGVPQSLAFTTNVLNGSVVAASCGEFDNGGGNMMVFYDGLGAHFTIVTSAGDGGTFRHGAAVYAGTVAGPLTINCLSTSSTFYTIMIGEYTGVDNRYPVGVFNSAFSASGSTKSAGAITTIRANQAILCFYYDDHIPGANFSATIGSGFTIREQTSTFGSNTQGGFADKIVSTIQTGLDPTWSDGTWSGDGVGLIILTLNEAFSTAPAAFLYQSDSATASGTSVLKVFPGPTPAGHLLFVGCIGVQAAVPTLTITDGTNTYTTIDTVNDSVASRAIWAYAKNVSGATYTPVCTSSLTGTALHLVIADISNVDTIAPLDQHAAIFITPGGTFLAPAQTAAITTTSPNELIIHEYFTPAASGILANTQATNYLPRIFGSSDGTSTHEVLYYDQYLTATGTFRPLAYSASQAPFFMISLSFISGPPSLGLRKSTIL